MVEMAGIIQVVFYRDISLDIIGYTQNSDFFCYVVFALFQIQIQQEQ